MFPSLIAVHFTSSQELVYGDGSPSHSSVTKQLLGEEKCILKHSECVAVQGGVYTSRAQEGEKSGFVLTVRRSHRGREGTR